MAEARARSALEGCLRPGRHGAGGDGVRLAELRPGDMAQIHGAPSGEALLEAFAPLGLDEAPDRLRAARGARLRLLWNGPGQYLAVSEEHRDGSLAAALREALAAHGATAVEVGHARSVLRLSGPAAPEVLAKGCPLDVDAMRPGDCASTVVGHFNVLVHRDDAHAFELHVTRSFAVAFVEWLLRAGAEFGVEVQ